jgi:lysozyme
MNDGLIFGLLRRFKQRWTGKQAGLTQAEVDEANAVLKAAKEDAPTPLTPKGILTSKGPPLAAIIGTIAATTLLTSIPHDEGWKLKAYKDIAGIWTICGGDTKNVTPGQLETEAGCQRRLEAQLIAHASPVMACTPALSEVGRDYQRAAAVSLAYNIGVRAYCHSSIDARFDAGDWKGACDSFLLYSKARVNGQLRVVQGLLSRRQRERATCLRNLT